LKDCTTPLLLNKIKQVAYFGPLFSRKIKMIAMGIVLREHLDMKTKKWMVKIMKGNHTLYYENMLPKL